MKTIFNLNAALAMLLTLFVSANCWAQGAPTLPEHDLLKKDVGVWDADCKFWMVPGQDPVETKAVETNKMLGGAWLVGVFKTEFDGAPFVGHSQTGYDPVKKKFVGTWIDNMNAHMAVQEGTYDKDKKTFTYLSQMTDAATGKKQIQKMVAKHIDEDHREFTVLAQVEGKKDEWRKSFEFKYTRRKGAEKKSK